VRRPATWLAVGVVLLVGVVAAADAVRQKASKPDVSSTTTTPAGTTTRPAPATGLSGVLYFTDDDCRLQGVQLPDLEQVGGPEWTECQFALSPDGRDIEAEGAVWSPAGTGKAVTGRGTIAVEWIDRASYSFAGSAPAFRGNGDLTFFSDGAIRQLPPRCSLRPVLQRCSRVVVPRRALERAARRHPNADVAPGLLSVSVREIAWLGSQEAPERLAALLRLRVRNGEEFDLIALFEGGGIVEVIASFERLSGLEASPGGSYFGVLTEGPADVLLFDRETRALPVPPVSGVRAFEWSPDEDWIALATAANVYIDLAERRQFVDPPPVRRIRILARDLAWRGVFISL
jgi:hypothetical protein